MSPNPARCRTERGNRVDPHGYEILVPLRAGPVAWTHLLRSGRAFGIACVGFDALERLAVSRHAGSR